MNLLGGGFGGGGGRNLVIRFIADTARASRNIDNLMLKIRKAQGMGTPGKDTAMGSGFRGIFGRMQYSLLKRLTGGFAEMGEAGEAALNGIAMKAGIATAAILAMGFALGKTFKYGNLVENAMIQLETLTGSEEKAHGLLGEAIKFSRQTRFKPAETFAATAASVQFGIDPFKKGAYGLPKDAKFMDIASSIASLNAMKGNPIGLGRALYGLLSGDRRVLRPAMGLVSPAWENAKKYGAVSSPQFREKFIEGLGKVPALLSLGKKYEMSMAGLWSTITGYAEEFWIKFSGAGEKRGVLTFWSQLKEILVDIRDAGDKFMAYIGPGLTEVGALLGAMFKFVWDMLKEIADILGPVIIPLFQIMWQISRAIGSTLIFFLQTFVKLVRFVRDLIGVQVDFINKIFGFSAAISGIVEGFTEFVTGLQILFQFASIFLDWLLKKIIDTVNEITNVLTFGLSNLNLSGLDKLDEFIRKYDERFKDRTVNFIDGTKKPSALDFIPGVGNKGAASPGSTYNIYYGIIPEMRPAATLTGDEKK